MDLSLRGSQVNLVERQKPKKKFSTQTNIPPQHIRPRSATFLQRRSRSSPFLCRPQSADPKFGRHTGSSSGHYCSENDFPATFKLSRNEKRYESVSSSSLLKLLLEEPIKRSWLCRDNSVGDMSSPDEHSELSTTRKTTNYSSLNKRTRTESAGGSSADGDASEKVLRSVNGQRRFSSKITGTISMSHLNKEHCTYTSTASSNKVTASDHWRAITSDINSHTLITYPPLQTAAKPDLPGRVSFSKPNMNTNDLDLSDCENDKQQQSNQFSMNSANKKDESISAPGPLCVAPPPFSFADKCSTAVSAGSDHSSALKKTVHFGAATGTDIVAETYEYPKCPSENCSCSTRSSSTASMNDGLDMKCACETHTCKYAKESPKKRSASFVQLELAKSSSELTKSQLASPPPIEESAVIREYKNAVGEQLENSVVKNLLVDSRSSLGSISNLNNVKPSSGLGRYIAPLKSDINLEKQNNLSESKVASIFYKSEAKKNELVKTVNNLDHQTLKGKAAYTSSSESVINNYLKVAVSTPIITTKKKDNNKPGLADSANASSQLKQVKGGISATPNSNSAASKAKSLSASSDHARLKKATSYSGLHEDSALSEFQLDKVDSWMSLHEHTAMRHKPLAKHSSLDDEFEKFPKPLGEVMGDAEDDEPGDTSSQISTKSDDNSQDDSTYDEIVSVLKQIEENKKQENYAECSITEMDLKLDTPSSTAEISQIPSERNEATSKSPDKYKDIITYLDNVEDSCDKTLLETRRSIPDSNRTEVEFVVEPDIAEDVPKLSELLMLPNHQLARRVIALSLRANELATAVVLSKENVLKIRTEKQKAIRAEKANSTNRIREQKKHFETIVKRHQGFIEQLLKDKGSLCEKVAALTRRLESQNQAWEHKLEAELTRTKETTLAGEKIRRERWVRENTKRIKELTVKGLEMEINKMNCNHQREVTELKRDHQQQLLDALDEARLKHEQIENNIRESCTQDREAIIEKERNAIRDRFERQLEEEQKSYDEQKQKLYEEFAIERERLQNELRAKEMEFQTKRQEMQREKDSDLDEVVAELQEKMSKQEEKYQNRINTIEKQYEADFALWKRDYENSCKMAQMEKENTIRQHYRAERDRQIDAIVSRMDTEAEKSAEEYELKLNRLKEKYEKDIEEVESAEKSLREKYTETRNKLAESDAQGRNFEAEMKQMKLELDYSKKMCNDFLTEREQLRDNVRNEVQTEVNTLKTEHDHEIQKIHKRVQQAIDKKDTTIDILQKENGSMRERCIKLEAIIRQQRKDYCVK